jgi:transposase
MNNKEQIENRCKSASNQARPEGTEARVLKLGLDVHYRQVTVAMQEDGGRIKVAGKMGHEHFEEWVKRRQSEGWKISSCYEAGASGYWLHRVLQGLGVNNLVVAPKQIATHKQKTDRRDCMALLDCLERYDRGQRRALSPIGVPSLEAEQKRALIRFHRQLLNDRGRCEARGKGLLCAQGIEVSGKWWAPKGWIELLQDARCQPWIKEQLQYWRQQLLRIEEKQKGLRQQIQALAPALRLPKGVGAYSAAVLEYELHGWERFNNRRAISSYTGLCPGIHQSDRRGREGSINRCGNRTVRWVLVEMVWRMVIWQPHYPPVRQLRAGLIKSRRAKKRLVVMAARRLAIDLWRLRSGQTTAEKLGLILQS